MSKLLDRFGRPLSPHLIVPRAQECRLYQFSDGFDNYNSASLMYETVGGSPSIGTAYRRFAPPSGTPGQGISLPTSAYVRKNMKSNQPVWIIKAAYCPLAMPSSESQILGLLDSGTSQVSICLTSAGAIAVYTGWERLGGNILLTSTGPGILATGQYYGIEWEVGISNSSFCYVWVNGVEVLAATGLNTQFTSDAYANQVMLGDGGIACYFDDFRVWDNTGSYQNAPLGSDSRIITKLPNGNGSTDQWTANGASANWQCVDDNPPDGDTTYVSCSTAGDLDEYTAPSAGFTVAPAMVAARVYARKDDGATREMEFGVVSSSAVGESSIGAIALSSTYAFYDGAIYVDPHTSAAWTAAGADAAGFQKTETV